MKDEKGESFRTQWHVIQRCVCYLYLVVHPKVNNVRLEMFIDNGKWRLDTNLSADDTTLATLIEEN